jgi:hypothetical protein
MAIWVYHKIDLQWVRFRFKDERQDVCLYLKRVWNLGTSNAHWKHSGNSGNHFAIGFNISYFKKEGGIMARTQTRDFLGIAALGFVALAIFFGLWPLRQVKHLTLKILPIVIAIII